MGIQHLEDLNYPHKLLWLSFYWKHEAGVLWPNTYIWKIHPSLKLAAAKPAVLHKIQNQETKQLKLKHSRAWSGMPTPFPTVLLMKGQQLIPSHLSLLQFMFYSIRSSYFNVYDPVTGDWCSTGHCCSYSFPAIARMPLAMQHHLLIYLAIRWQCSNIHHSPHVMVPGNPFICMVA